MRSCAVENWKAGSKYLIMVPYAHLSNMETGMNVAARNSNKQMQLYLKNCCVALVSAKAYNPDADVALVTNIEIPEPYMSILDRADVAVIRVPFDKFNFGEKYAWGLAFYKLCAQYHISRHTDYEAVACLDSDVYVQASFRPVWEQVGSSVMFYRLGTGTAEIKTTKIYAEAASFKGVNEAFTHYGGEFFVASSEQMRMMTQKEEAVFEQMMERGFRVTTGDEFISSLVANTMQEQIVPANAFVFRFWTGTYRSISDAYRTTIICLHVPAEKGTGMIRLFDCHISKGRIPSREKVWKMLHISHRGAKVAILTVAKKLLRRQ